MANYTNLSELSIRQRYSWAVLDTFDMLSPQYDQPQTEDQVSRTLQANGIVGVKRLSSVGINLVGQKRG